MFYQDRKSCCGDKNPSYLRNSNESATRIFSQYDDIDSLVQDCSISSALAMQSCTKPIYSWFFVMTWAPWYFKSSVTWLVVKQLVKASNKENIMTPHFWPLWRESTGDCWIPLTQRTSAGENVSVSGRHHTNQIKHVGVELSLDVIEWKHFGVTGHLYGEFTGHRLIPHTKATDTELWCFLWSAPE